MLPSPAAAEATILASLPLLPGEHCALTRAAGRILREPVRADRPMPPFDRVTMDGYALRAAAVATGRKEFVVKGLQAAGMIPLTIASEDACIEIATGAVLPQGADAVVPYEAVLPSPPEATGATRVIQLPPDLVVPEGLHVHRKGSDFAASATLLEPGLRLGGGEIAVAAACGAAHVTVASRPRVAVVATGDELVEVDTPTLAPHQIRRSNDHAIQAALQLSGLAGTVERFHLRDLRHEVESGLRHWLAEFDVVLLTGGVSRGKFDFVPAALTALGVEEKLRGVAQRPGKPMWFGVSPRKRPVFGLPGNPVSAYTCLHRYVLPALGQMAGLRPREESRVVLDQQVEFSAPLTYFLPVATSGAADGRRHARPAPFNTSGDLGGLVGTDGFVELPAGSGTFSSGTVARFWSWT